MPYEVDEGGATRTVLFSGDIGQPDRPLIHDPWTATRADYLVMESTYGDRDHEHDGDVLDRLADAINDTVARGGNILIPTFAIDRAQEMLYLLSRLVAADRIPRLTTFLDSPMAVDATTVYKRYKYLLDDGTQELLKRGEHPFQFDGLHLVRGSRESRAINSIRGSCIIMSSAGMCAATLALAEERGLAIHLLEDGYDVDGEADLWRLRADLEAWRALGGADDDDFPHHTEAVLRELAS